MDRIPAGRVLRTDMGNDKWGLVIYMVVNQPIVCETCNSVIFDWREIDGEVVCPACGHLIVNRYKYLCPVCGRDDYHTLKVITNNNWFYDSTTGQVNEYNDKQGVTVNTCGKRLMDDIRSGRLTLLTEKEGRDLKRKLVWTSSMDYDPEKPIPQAIIDRFP